MLTWQSPEELNTILEHVCVCMLSHFSRVWLFATPWTVALQAPLSMGFSSQECWSGLPCPSLLGASLRNSAHGKGNEEGGFSIRKGEIKPLGNPLFPSIYPQNQGLPTLLFYALTYTHITSFWEGVNLQLQVNKNSWAWQECFNLVTPLKVI